MTVNLALEYIPRRMRELGYGRHYYLRFRHLVLNPGEEREIAAFGQFYILVEDADDVVVESEFGVFNLSAPNVNEMIYEHQGQMLIKNLASSRKHLRFIQVIPKRSRL